MELRLYDTLTREKRVFAPLDPARVRMYVCGPTVYDFAHIGNARPVIVFDVLFRLLRHIYGADHVTYVRNVTDVDDKINARAAERGVSIRDLTEETYKNFQDDVAALGCLEPTIEPRATEHIEPMKLLIDRLVECRPCLCGGRQRAVPRAVDAGLRPALETPAGRDDRRQPRRGRALQEGPAGFRAVEAVEAGRAGLAVAGRRKGAGPARLAHRVLGHGLEASGRDFRHPRRRHRSGVSASRERDRAIALRISYWRDGELLDAQRLPAGRKARRCRRASATS